MATRMLQRRGTSAEWAASNPVLGEGEIGIEKDTKVIKIGDGVTAWLQLDTAFEDPPVTSVFGRAGNVTATSADIEDLTEVGASLLTAIDGASARSAIGAGTGNGDVVGVGVLSLRGLLKSEYDALSVKDATTLYVIRLG